MIIGLGKRAQSFEGKRVKLTRSGIGVVTMKPEFTILRRTQAGEVGRIVGVSDAGFAGLLFRVELTTGERINAYEGDVQVIG